jgi:hypothetical protein
MPYSIWRNAALSLLAFVVVAALVGCGASTPASPPTSQNAVASSTAEPEPLVPQIGEVVSFTLAGGKTGTVQLGRSKPIGDESTLTGYYLQVQIHNTGSEPIATGDWSFDGDYGVTDDSDYADDIAPLQLPDELKPSGTAAGWIIVESTDDSSDPTTLTLDTGSDGVIRFAMTKLPSGGVEIPGLDANLNGRAKRAKAVADAEYDSSTVDYAEYKAIHNGMTVKQVRRTIGFDGKESASSGGYRIIDWANDDGSNMSVTFRNGAVVSKAQAGLN